MNTGRNQRRGRGCPRNVDGDSPNAKILREIGQNGSIDRDSATPLWVQLKNALSEKIAKNALRPDDCLPSEQTMCDIFNVSRPVVNAVNAVAASVHARSGAADILLNSAGIARLHTATDISDDDWHPDIWRPR